MIAQPAEHKVGHEMSEGHTAGTDLHLLSLQTKKAAAPHGPAGSHCKPAPFLLQAPPKLLCFHLANMACSATLSARRGL